MTAVTEQQAAERLDDLVDEANREHSAIDITRDGTRVAVLVDADRFYELHQTLIRLGGGINT